MEEYADCAVHVWEGVCACVHRGKGSVVHVKRGSGNVCVVGEGKSDRECGMREEGVWYAAWEVCGRCVGSVWEVCGCRNVCVVVRGEVMVDGRVRRGLGARGGWGDGRVMAG